MRRSIIPTLGRALPDLNPQFVAPRLNPGGAISGNIPADPSQMKQPGGSVSKTANVLAYAAGIDNNVTNANANQSVLFLPQSDSWRNFLMLRNASALANIFIGVGQDASLLSTIRLAAGQTIMLLDTVVLQNDLYFMGDQANVSLSFLYSTVKPDWMIYG